MYIVDICGLTFGTQKSAKKSGQLFKKITSPGTFLFVFGIFLTSLSLSHDCMVPQMSFTEICFFFEKIENFIKIMKCWF